MTLFFSSWLHGVLMLWRAAQNPLLGQLDITTAEAQMAQRELAIVKADALALQEDVRALEEEVLYERETSMAARRRADAFERQMADHERKVRTTCGRSCWSQSPWSRLLFLGQTGLVGLRTL